MGADGMTMTNLRRELHSVETRIRTVRNVLGSVSDTPPEVFAQLDRIDREVQRMAHELRLVDDDLP